MRKLLTIGALIAGLGLGSCATTKGVENLMQETDWSYADSEYGVKDGLINEIKPSIEELVITADYGIGQMQGGCTATTIGSDEKFHYFLTANHCVDVPQTLHLPTGIINLVTPAKYEIEGEKVEVIAKNKVTNGHDYAVLRAKRDDSKFRDMPFRTGDSDHLETGDFVYALGYSLMLDLYLTKGSISTDRISKGDGYTNYNGFTFTAQISGGNSGGPIFAVRDGEIFWVGMTSAQFKGGADMNIGYRISDIRRDIKRQGFNLPFKD